jgi:hypothetical protein
MSELNAEELAGVVFASGHMTVDGTGGRALKYHLMTCPTCLATAKTVEAILAARLADADARLTAVEALADEWTGDEGRTIFHNAAVDLRAALHPDPSEAP